MKWNEKYFMRVTEPPSDFYLSPSTWIRFSKCERYGEKLIDLRIWYRKIGGEETPTLKGLTVKKDLWVEKILPVLNEEIAA